MDKPVFHTRKATLQTQHEFDREYWQRMGPAAIFDAAAQMVDEVCFFKGVPENEREFQRNVVKIYRRKL